MRIARVRWLDKVKQEQRKIALQPKYALIGALVVEIEPSDIEPSSLDQRCHDPDIDMR
jgi:hypothetical protein